MSAIEGCPAADCATMGECKAHSVGMPEHCQSGAGSAAIVGYVRAASTDLISGQYIVREPLDTHQVALVRLGDLQSEQAAHAETKRQFEAIRADLREAYVEASFYLKQLMDANEDEVDLAQKARLEELRALTWR